MMQNIPPYPLQWPMSWKRTDFHKKSAFDQARSFKQAANLLEVEIKRFGGIDTVISCNDLGGRKKVDDPGVAVYFFQKGQNLVFACDKWLTVSENTYALFKYVEALRGMERWVNNEFQDRAVVGFLTGNQDLPPKSWHEVLGLSPDADLDVAEAVYKHKVKTLHPDVGGDTAAFQELNTAIQQAREIAKRNETVKKISSS